MARPKGTNPPKDKIHLAVSKQTRAYLDYLSQETGESISELVALWAEKEARKHSKKSGTDIPDPNQYTLDV